MDSVGVVQPQGSLAVRARYGVLVIAFLFALGAATQLFLAGLSTFDSGLYWDEHVFLGRIVALFALLLPVMAVLARLGRWFIVLSVVAALLYVVQTLLTYIDIGPVAALHALNALPLVVIPALVGMRVLETIRRGGPPDRTSAG